MANISTLITTVKTAQQGADVRDAIADTLTAVNADNVAITSLSAATQTALSTLEYEKLSSYATNLDANKIYVNNEWKRPDGTTYAKSTLIGTTPTYSQVKMDYYDAAGTAIINAITWNLSYDVNGFPYQRVVV